GRHAYPVRAVEPQHATHAVLVAGHELQVGTGGVLGQALGGEAAEHGERIVGQADHVDVVAVLAHRHVGGREQALHGAAGGGVAVAVHLDQREQRVGGAAGVQLQ